ncbi:hypothetical protein I4U23_010850 [Adineta vaga]|nr:hypothetical protein I4U23_010850 [Adineta vaga]
MIGDKNQNLSLLNGNGLNQLTYSYNFKFDSYGGRPIGLIATSYGGTPIGLWMPRDAFLKCYPSSMADPMTNSSLYNGMIHQFTRMVIYGVIWYQDESNSGRNNDKYVCTFTNLIQSWRQI